MEVFLLVVAIGFLIPSTVMLLLAAYFATKQLLKLSLLKISLLYAVFVFSLALLLYLLL